MFFAAMRSYSFTSVADTVRLQKDDSSACRRDHAPASTVLDEHLLASPIVGITERGESRVDGPAYTNARRMLRGTIYRDGKERFRGQQGSSTEMVTGGGEDVYGGRLEQSRAG